MSIAEPIPGIYGKANWVDYSNYWREVDAEWIQDRIVVRVLDDSSRDALGNTPGAVVYNAAKDALEWRSAAGGYKVITPVSPNLTTTETAGPPATTTLAHKDAGNKGIVFGAAEVGFNHKVNILAGVVVMDATGVALKTGAKTAKLTTDAANLVSDTPISAPGVVITAPGTLNATGRAGTFGTLTVEGLLTTASATVTGALNAGSGTIGGVAHAGNKLTASAGLDVQGGSFYGDGGSAIMRNAARTGPYVQSHNGGVNIGGPGYMDILASIQPRVFTNTIQYIRSDGAHTGYLAVSFYGGDPGVGNVPEGAIWIS